MSKVLECLDGRQHCQIKVFQKGVENDNGAKISPSDLADYIKPGSMWTLQPPVNYVPAEDETVRLAVSGDTLCLVWPTVWTGATLVTSPLDPVCSVDNEAPAKPINNENAINKAARVRLDKYKLLRARLADLENELKALADVPAAWRVHEEAVALGKLTGEVVKPSTELADRKNRFDELTKSVELTRAGLVTATKKAGDELSAEIGAIIAAERAKVDAIKREVITAVKKAIAPLLPSAGSREVQAMLRDIAASVPATIGTLPLLSAAAVGREDARSDPLWFSVVSQLECTLPEAA